MFACGLHKRRLENHSPTKACKHGKPDEHQFAVFVQSQGAVPLGKFFAVGKHAKQAVDEGLAHAFERFFGRVVVGGVALGKAYAPLFGLRIDVALRQRLVCTFGLGIGQAYQC